MNVVSKFKQNLSEYHFYMIPLYVSQESEVRSPLLWWLCQWLASQLALQRLWNGWLDFWFIAHSLRRPPAGSELFCPLVNRWSHIGCSNDCVTRNCDIMLSKDPSALSSCPGICLSGCWNLSITLILDTETSYISCSISVDKSQKSMPSASCFW